MSEPSNHLFHNNTALGLQAGSLPTVPGGSSFAKPRLPLSTLSAVGGWRPAFLLRLLLLTWIITKLLCFPLWLGDRDFPTVPVHDLLLQVRVYWHAILFWAAIGLMAVGILVPQRKLLAAILLLEVLSCLLDRHPCGRRRHPATAECTAG